MLTLFVWFPLNYLFVVDNEVKKQQQQQHKFMLSMLFVPKVYLSTHTMEINIREQPTISKILRSLLSPIWSYPNKSKSWFHWLCKWLKPSNHRLSRWRLIEAIAREFGRSKSVISRKFHLYNVTNSFKSPKKTGCPWKTKAQEERDSAETLNGQLVQHCSWNSSEARCWTA